MVDRWALVPTEDGGVEVAPLGPDQGWRPGRRALDVHPVGGVGGDHRHGAAEGAAGGPVEDGGGGLRAVDRVRRQVDHRGGGAAESEIHAVWPRTRYLPAKTRAAIDALAHEIPSLSRG